MHAPQMGVAMGEAQPAVQVRLIERFSVSLGSREVELPPSCQRPVVHLALSHRSEPRARLAAALWPDSPARAGLARLRNALWRINRVVPDLVTASGTGASLNGHVAVDLEEAYRTARRLLDHDDDGRDSTARDLFQYDLLVDWDDDWLDVERQVFARLRLRVLEEFARRDLAALRFHEAERACRSVIQIEPYRESAHLLLADVYVTEGNVGLALRQLNEFQQLLEHDLGIRASDRIQDLESAIRGHG